MVWCILLRIRTRPTVKSSFILEIHLETVSAVKSPGFGKTTEALKHAVKEAPCCGTTEGACLSLPAEAAPPGG
jgi:hypothetical protein